MAAFSLRPLRDQVLLQPLAPETRVQDGVFIPDTGNAENKQQRRCRVLAVGPRVWSAKVDDLVAIPDYDGRVAGQRFQRAGKNYTLIRERDLTGILQKTA